MEYTVVQVAGDLDSVFGAMHTLLPGLDRGGTASRRGWSAARLDRRSASWLAPRLAELLRREVLVWDAHDGRTQLALHLPTGHGPRTVSSEHGDRGIEDLAASFNVSELLASSEDEPEGASAAIAGDSATTWHRTVAQRLGIPCVVPPRASGGDPSTAADPVTAQRGPAQFRRRQRIRSARSWLHLFSGLGLVAIVGLVIRGPWIAIPVFLAVIGVMQLIRYMLGRSLGSET